MCQIPFFYCCRASDHFVRCGFVYVIVCYGAANCQCCRAPLFSRVFSAYGAAHFVPVSFTCATRHGAARAAEWSLRLCVVPRTPWRRAPVCCVYVPPRIFVCGRAVLCIAAHSRVVTNG